MYILYLFCIQIFIVYLSRKFVFFTRLVRKNFVGVLATITVLCCSRMLYIGYYALSYNSIYCLISNITSQPQRVTVSKFDGNITYFGLKHIPLFIVALIFTIFVFLFHFLSSLGSVPSEAIQYQVSLMGGKIEAILRSTHWTLS